VTEAEPKVLQIISMTRCANGAIKVILAQLSLSKKVCHPAFMPYENTPSPGIQPVSMVGFIKEPFGSAFQLETGVFAGFIGKGKGKFSGEWDCKLMVPPVGGSDTRPIPYTQA